MFFIDPMYLLLVFLPTLLISGLCSWRVKAAFKKYSKVRSMNGYSGAQAARMILDREGLQDVQVTETGGFLTDHYDPRNKTLALSAENYRGTSVVHIGIAAHEAGHAIQDAQNYGPWGNSSLNVIDVGCSLPTTAVSLRPPTWIATLTASSGLLIYFGQRRSSISYVPACVTSIAQKPFPIAPLRT